MTRRQPLSALLLDLDGTIADTHGLILRCLNDAMTAHAGIPFDKAAWRRAVGLPLEDVFRTALADCGKPADLAPALAAAYRTRLAEVDGDVAAFPGVVEALRAVAGSGVRLAVVTTKWGAFARRYLRQLGLDDLFPVVVSGDQVTRPKPDAEPFTRAAELLGVDPSRAAGVGDSPHDVAGSRAAGLLAVAAMWGAEDRAAVMAAGPDVVLESPGELTGLIDSRG
jgi:HAD superfamily hydrolase (TIGR01509 family)